MVQYEDAFVRKLTPAVTAAGPVEVAAAAEVVAALDAALDAAEESVAVAVAAVDSADPGTRETL